MLISILQRYSLKITFALTLLIGLQVPHFLSLYENRLDAHYLESKAQLKQYQKLADFLFKGDLSALLEKHKNSDVVLFSEETKIIEALVNRTDFLYHQKISLQGSVFKRFAFLATQINQPIFIETKNNYQANIVLNKEAIIVGLIIATLITLQLELLFHLFTFLIKKLIKKEKPTFQTNKRSTKIN
jgi:hypothetical protein